MWPDCLRHAFNAIDAFHWLLAFDGAADWTEVYLASPPCYWAVPPSQRHGVGGFLEWVMTKLYATVWSQDKVLRPLRLLPSRLPIPGFLMKDQIMAISLCVRE